MATPPRNLFKLFEINLNSIISIERRQNLQTFIKDHNPHAILTVETVLLPKHKVDFPNYTFIRNDKNAHPGGRGTGILLKKKHSLYSHRHTNTSTPIHRSHSRHH